MHFLSVSNQTVSILSSSRMTSVTLLYSLLMAQCLQLWQDSLENDAHLEKVQVNSADPIYTNICKHTQKPWHKKM